MVRSLPWLSSSNSGAASRKASSVKQKSCNGHQQQTATSKTNLPSSPRSNKHPRLSSTLNVSLNFPSCQEKEAAKSRNRSPKHSVASSSSVEGDHERRNEGKDDDDDDEDDDDKDGDDKSAVTLSFEKMRNDGYDDQYMMVEDELLSTAQEFTKSLHKAEYKRLKRTLLASSKAASSPHATPVATCIGTGIPNYRPNKKKRKQHRQTHLDNSDDDSTGSECDTTIRDSNLAGLMNRGPYSLADDTLSKSAITAGERENEQRDESARDAAAQYRREEVPARATASARVGASKRTRMTRAAAGFTSTAAADVNSGERARTMQSRAPDQARADRNVARGYVYDIPASSSSLGPTTAAARPDNGGAVHAEPAAVAAGRTAPSQITTESGPGAVAAEKTTRSSTDDNQHSQQVRESSNSSMRNLNRSSSLRQRSRRDHDENARSTAKKKEFKVEEVPTFLF